jgi:hypothetical protein
MKQKQQDGANYMTYNGTLSYVSTTTARILKVVMGVIANREIDNKIVDFVIGYALHTLNKNAFLHFIGKDSVAQPQDTEKSIEISPSNKQILFVPFNCAIETETTNDPSK